MPKLPVSEASAVDEFEGNEYPVLEPGVYTCILFDVKVGEGKAGPYWNWEYHLHGGNARFWNITSLSEKARFKMKETFDAFGLPADTDTDMLIGRKVSLQIGIGTINAGAREGQQRNEVVQVLPYDDSNDVVYEDF